jgi:hypothetical protein
MPSDLASPYGVPPRVGAESCTIARGVTMTQHPTGTIGSSIDWLREQLDHHSYPVKSGSPLQIAFSRCVRLRACFEVHRGPRLDFPETLRFYGDGYGIDWMSKVIRRAVRDGMEVNRRFWAALGDPRADVIVTRAGRPSQSRDLVWELILGALCQRVATKVAFEEPDVRCQFQGRTIAIAAKVVYRRRNIWTNAVTKGISQANGRGSVALVAVNTANVAPIPAWLRKSHVRGFSVGPRAGEWASLRTATWCYRALQLEPAMVNLAPLATMPTGVVFFVPVLLVVEEQPVPFFYFHMPVTAQGERGPDFEFVSALCQTGNTTLDRVGTGTE